VTIQKKHKCSIQGGFNAKKVDTGSGGQTWKLETIYYAGSRFAPLTRTLK